MWDAAAIIQTGAAYSKTGRIIVLKIVILFVMLSFDDLQMSG